MANRRTSWTNAYETTLASGMDQSTSTMLVQDASALSVPCYLVIEPDEPAQREYVYVASKAGNTLTVSERYLDGSGAVSGLSHDTNSTVRSVALAQGFTDLHDRIDSLDSTVATLPHSALVGLSSGDDHPQYLLRTDATTDYAPLVHTHEVADITDMNWSWSGLPGKPSTFAPSAHTHPWSEVTGKPSTFAPSAHTHTWSQITNPPATYTPSAHTHSGSDITSGTVPVARLPVGTGANQVASGSHQHSQIVSGSRHFRVASSGGSGHWLRNPATTSDSGWPSWRIRVGIDDATEWGLARFTSSIRYKTHVEPLAGALDKILALRPVTFRSKHDADKGKTLTGLIAEEVHEVIPQVVTLDDEGLPDSISLDGLVPYLIAAVHELHATVRGLQDRSM